MESSNVKSVEVYKTSTTLKDVLIIVMFVAAIIYIIRAFTK